MPEGSQSPEIKWQQPDVTLSSLAELNRYDIIGRELERFIANGELADYDDEIANRVKDAIRIVRGVCSLAGVSLIYGKP